MAFLHGKSTQILFNEYDLSAYFNEASISQAVETAETTAFGAAAKSYIVGLKDGNVSLSGMFDGSAAAIDAEMSDVIGSNDGGVITVSTAGITTVGTRVNSGLIKTTSYEISSPVGDVVSASAEFQVDGGVGNAISLRAVGADTGTTNNTSHDSTASTANGGFGVLHVTANTMNAGNVFRVQHSADNSTWATLATFATIGATTLGAEQKTVAAGTTVNRYLRSTYTASGAGSITYHINFARG